VLRAGTLLYQGDTRTLIDEHLAPSWLVRLSGPVDDVVTKLRASAWVRRAEVLDGGEVRVDADTMRHGEQGIPEVLASCRAGLIACEPRAADLETAFLALTGKQEQS
jgi:ABC-2 type transport system ATP-binding protein